MGAMCCIQSSNKNKYEFVSTEQDALIDPRKNLLTTDVHEECRDPQIKMENEGVSVEDSAHPNRSLTFENGADLESEKEDHLTNAQPGVSKSDFQELQQTSLVFKLSSGLEGNFTAVKQEDRHHPQQLCTDMESATTSEFTLVPSECEKAEGSPNIALDFQANQIFCHQISIENEFAAENEKNEHFTVVKQEDCDRPQPLRTNLESATTSEFTLAPPECEKAEGSPNIASDLQANQINFTAVKQEDRDHPQPLCTDLESATTSEFTLAPSECEKAEGSPNIALDFQANQMSLAVENRADLESEKEDFRTNTQPVINESDVREPADTLWQASVVLKTSSVLEGNVSIGDQNTASHMLENNGCSAFVKWEQSIEQQPERNNVNCGPLNSMQHEDGSHCLQESAGVMGHSGLETSVMTTKRVNLSPECDHRDNQTVNLAEGTKGLMQVVDSHGDESEATNSENKQSDPGKEEAFRDQQSEGQIDTDEKTAEDLCDPVKFQHGFDGLITTNEKSAAKPEDAFEDLYRDKIEIEEEKSKTSLTHENKITAPRDPSSLGPNVDILEYCAREWKSSTTKAQLIKKAYSMVHHTFSSLRRVRGDNYCALRATLFQVLSNVELPEWIQDDMLLQYPEKLITENYIWIKQWNFGAQDSRNENPVEKLKGYLTLLKCTWTDVSGMASQERQSACEKIFSSETEEYSLFEALKFLMLVKAIELDHDKLRENEVPLFCWLLFARDTSDSPYMFMKNHLNHVGHTGGLDQVEMFLLGYTMQLTIRVFRLYKFGTDEFITFYPDDHQEDWPTITLITEDDRHYNVLVGELKASRL